MTSKFVHSILLATGAILGVLSLAIITFYLTFGKLPDLSTVLCSWDCGWYSHLRDNGYVLLQNAESNPAFFPLFPYVWRWLHLPQLGMSILNAIIFIASFAAIGEALELKTPTKVLFLTTGLIAFFMIPYSESFFFLGGSILLVGLHRNQFTLTVSGVIIAVLSRSAGIIFVAAAVVMLLIAIFKKQQRQLQLMVSLVLSVAFTMIGVFIIQYIQTGNFFAFFYAQQFWDHHFGIPSFPLTSWHWPTHVSDSAALCVGLIAGFICVLYIAQQLLPSYKIPLLSKWFAVSAMSNAYVFSFLYLGGTALTILLFQGGNLHSLNRYVFATPFMLLFINAFVSGEIKALFTYKAYAAVIVVLGIAFPRETYVEHYLLIIASSILIPGAILFYNRYIENKKLRWLHIASMAIGLTFQCILFYRYFLGSWMG